MLVFTIIGELKNVNNDFYLKITTKRAKKAHKSNNFYSCYKNYCTK